MASAEGLFIVMPTFIVKHYEGMKESPLALFR
jgi:hypothetical protein